LDQVSDYLSECDACNCRLAGVLIDSYSQGQFGGTGKVVDWNSVRDWSTKLASIPLILAGGLTNANVANAIEIVQPTAVDAASGVESSPGVKDHEALRRFVAAAKAAFNSN